MKAPTNLPHMLPSCAWPLRTAADRVGSNLTWSKLHSASLPGGFIALVTCSCFSTTVEEQVSYGGKVVGESAMKRVEDIGNEVIHKYFVSTYPYHEISVFV